MNENQINRHPKRKFSVEEKINYCTEWEKSDLNRAAFCEAHGISRSALYQWTKEFKKEYNDLSFSPLIIKKKPPVTDDLIQLNIVFSNNHMQLNISIPEHRLVSFIQEIGYATTIVR